MKSCLIRETCACAGTRHCRTASMDNMTKILINKKKTRAGLAYAETALVLIGITSPLFLEVVDEGGYALHGLLARFLYLNDKLHVGLDGTAEVLYLIQ